MVNRAICGMNVEAHLREVGSEVEVTTNEGVRAPEVGLVGENSPMIVIIVENPDIGKRIVSNGRKNNKETDSAEERVDGNVEAEK